MSSINLTEKQKLLYRKLQIILYFFTIIVLTLFGKKLLFPTFEFNYFENGNKNNNTITEPYLNKNGSGFDISTYGNFNKAKITLKLNNKEKNLPEKTILKLRKSYSSFLSPITNEKNNFDDIITYKIEDKYYLLKNNELCQFISENAFNSYLNKQILDGDKSLFDKYPKAGEIIGFANGSVLGVENDGVYIIEDSKKRPFGDEFILKSFGYEDDNVKFVNNGELSANKKDKMFLATDHHPDGTIFYTNDTNKYFIFQNQNLYPIKKAEKSIKIEEESRVVYTECELKKNWLNEYVCNLDLKNIENFKGNFYEFSVIDVPELKVKNIQVKFSQKLNKENLFRRIAKIKDLFTNRY